MVPAEVITNIVRDVLEALGHEHPEPMRLRALVDEAATRHIPAHEPAPAPGPAPGRAPASER